MAPSPPRQLVDVDAWVQVERGEDPFWPGLPLRVDCDPLMGMGPAPFGAIDVFEVSTGWCNWATVEQPLLDDVAAGEMVRPRVWHFELTAPEPAEGYAGVAIEGEILWEYRTPIPAPSALASHGWITETEIPAGTLVQFHVDNHGLNSWNLVEITAEAASDEASRASSG